MSTEILHRAASRMRERAEAATPGPWVSQGSMVVYAPGPTAKYVSDCMEEPGASEADAEHIAGMHPAVALAVADWLDQHAEQHGPSAGRDECVWNDHACHALAVARAYLGESA